MHHKTTQSIIIHYLTLEITIIILLVISYIDNHVMYSEYKLTFFTLLTYITFVIVVF